MCADTEMSHFFANILEAMTGCDLDSRDPRSAEMCAKLLSSVLWYSLTLFAEWGRYLYAAVIMPPRRLEVRHSLRTWQGSI